MIMRGNQTQTRPRKVFDFLNRHRTLMGFGLAVLVAIVCYFAGATQGRGAMNAQKSAYEAQLQSARTQLVAADSRAHLMAARGSVYRAAADLDSRNFGTADSDLQNAAKSLASVDAVSAGVDPTALAGLQQEVAQVKIVVATNFADQHALIIELALKIDRMLPEDSAVSS
jgi:hypothetical protein